MLQTGLAHTTQSLRQQQLELRRLRWSVLAQTIVACAALPVLLLPGMPEGRWVAVLGTSVCVVSAAVKWRAADPARGTAGHLLGVSSLAMAVGALLLEAYFGVGSAVAALITRPAGPLGWPASCVWPTWCSPRCAR